MTATFNPALYILMRNDMESLTPGKGMAQASHAANQFETAMKKDVMDLNIHQGYEYWKTEANGFGTAIVLSVDYNELLLNIDYAKSRFFLADFVHDPTYPVEDGKVTHLVPIDTCGYIFAPNMESPLIGFLKSLPLY